MIPAVQAGRRAAERSKAQLAIRELNNAFETYHREYGGWPTGVLNVDASADTEANTAGGIEIGIAALRMLRGDFANGENRKRICFLKAADPDSGQNDPWGRPYRCMLDFNFDGKVHVAFTANDGKVDLTRPAAVWSSGPDGSDRQSDNGWKDDVCSWGARKSK
jgi:type II secretory pathway pseudopilin PulG